MPEEIKKTAAAAAKALNRVPADKREIAARMAETFASGLAAGMELAEAKERKEEPEE